MNRPITKTASRNSRKSRRRRALLIIAAIFVIAAVICILRWGPGDQFFSPAKKGKGLTKIPPAPAPEPELRIQSETIKNGSTIAEILSGRGFTPRDIHELKEGVRPVYDLSKICTGQEFRFVTTAAGAWDSFEYDIDKINFLVVRKDSGTFRARIVQRPVETRLRLLGGVIEDSLIAAVESGGGEEQLAYKLEDIFGSDIDFYTDLRRDDWFKVLVEEKIIDRKFSEYGNVLAAEFSNQGQLFRAFRFVYPDTERSDYFDAAGQSLRKEILKSPIKYARITSRFSSRRLHPIHKIFRPHYGVDYAAPIGTPVQATADGVVVSAGLNGGAGRMIRIRHKNGYETMYLHLSGYARGIRTGARVEAKQVIGFVGSSGESTGPHLDYRILYHGKYINPLARKFRPAEPLRKEYLPAFKKDVEKLDFALSLDRLLIRFLVPFSSF